MSNKTQDFEKKGVIENVKQHLIKLDNHKKQLEKLENESDIDKAYVVALRYGRKYIHLDDKKKREEFFKESHWLGRKLERLGTNEVNEKELEELCEAPLEGNSETSDEKFVKQIEEVDAEKDAQIDSKMTDEVVEYNELLKSAIDSGVTEFYSSFVDGLNLKLIPIGVNNGNNFVYLSEYKKMIVVLNNCSYVEKN